MIKIQTTIGNLSALGGQLPGRDFIVCCDDFAKALMSGTDNEGYGPLIYFHDDYWMMGDNLPTLEFCPWCGKSVADNIPLA